MAQKTLLQRMVAFFATDDSVTDAEVQEVVAKFTATPPEPPPAKPVEIPVETPPAKPDESADFSKNPEFVRLQTQNAEFSRRLLETDATAWADGEITARRALPAERDTMIALFTQATLDDAADAGLAKFSEGAKKVGGCRVEVLRKSLLSRPAHTLYAEFLANQSPDGANETLLIVPATANFSAKGGAVDPKEIEELRGYSHILRSQAEKKASA